MTIYNMLEANNGEPVAKITPYKKHIKKVGCLEGKYNYNPDIDWFNDDMTKLFFGEEK